jgi:hypothetical protein
LEPDPEWRGHEDGVLERGLVWAEREQGEPEPDQDEAKRGHAEPEAEDVRGKRADASVQRDLAEAESQHVPRELDRGAPLPDRDGAEDGGRRGDGLNPHPDGPVGRRDDGATSPGPGCRRSDATRRW